MFTRPRFEFSYVWIADSVRQWCTARAELKVMADGLFTSDVSLSFLVCGVI
jgi:hypothetical protein